MLINIKHKIDHKNKIKLHNLEIQNNHPGISSDLKVWLYNILKWRTISKP